MYKRPLRITACNLLITNVNSIRTWQRAPPQPRAPHCLLQSVQAWGGTAVSLVHVASRAAPAQMPAGPSASAPHSPGVCPTVRVSLLDSSGPHTVIFTFVVDICLSSVSEWSAPFWRRKTACVFTRVCVATLTFLSLSTRGGGQR